MPWAEWFQSATGAAWDDFLSESPSDGADRHLLLDEAQVMFPLKPGFGEDSKKDAAVRGMPFWCMLKAPPPGVFVFMASTYGGQAGVRGIPVHLPPSGNVLLFRTHQRTDAAMSAPSQAWRWLQLCSCGWLTCTYLRIFIFLPCLAACPLFPPVHLANGFSVTFAFALQLPRCKQMYLLFAMQ